jgi:hypothetical protein
MTAQSAASSSNTAVTSTTVTSARDFIAAIGVVIGKGPKALKVGADFQKRRPEFLGPADTGEGKYAPALERRRLGARR